MKKILILLVIGFLILVTGCGRTTPNLEPELIEYHKGTQGLEMNFVRNLPPDEISEGSEFIIGLELRNKGAYDIENGEISVSGYDQSKIQINEHGKYFNIEGKKPGFPEGGYEIINFRGKNIDFPKIKETDPARFKIITRYDYQTEAGAEVCINPDIYSHVKTKEKICEPKEIILSDGQGAPVAVTKIQQEAVPFENRIRIKFNIYMENKGEGDIKDNITLDEVRLANVPITCTKNNIELEEDEKIECYTEILAGAGAYLTSLSIKLDYGYISRIGKIVQIRKQ
ncbi:hypothetical protein GF361_01430 [Candidatus Woesearchaeota archaeon]|nr:hypothetical protein [Candidatus Woesearchaeota archaeon]